MKIQLQLLTFFLAISVCGQTTVRQQLDVAPMPYANFLDNVRSKKKTFTDVKKAKPYLFKILNNDIPQYWIGTKWDFYGMTRQPKEGTIACGYFVTNTLKDLGFDIPRIKFAQAPSSKMINELCVNIKRFSNFEKLKTHVLQQPDRSIFIIGLDFHVGYLLRTSNEIYFFHSNYINREGVIKESAVKSTALKSSKTFMIGNLTENTALIKKWMK